MLNTEVMIVYILKRFSIIGFLFIMITCNVNSGRSKVEKVPMNDTLKIDGCRDKIKTDVGSIIEIRLEAVPGSGYQWLLKDSSKLLQLLDADSLKFSTPESKEPTPGAPGHQILHFKAMKKGEETIQLEYKRTWEKEVSNNCTVRIEII